MPEQAAEAVSGEAWAEEERRAARLGLRVRLAGIAVLGAALLARVEGAALAYYLAALGVLALSGWLHYRITARDDAGRWRWIAARAGLIALDMGLLTAAIVVPAPGTAEAWPAAMQLRLGNIGFLFVFLAFAALTVSPLLALWTGVAAALAWVGGVLWVLTQPGSHTLPLSELAALPVEGLVAALLAPGYVSSVAAGQEALLLLVAGCTMGAAVLRGRRLALRQIAAARAETRLARYFSPDMAEALKGAEADIEALAVREAAVLFADVRGFTRLAEAMSPEETIAFLRRFHREATAAVFAERGTLNKFIGDEVMASFGALADRPDAAAAALRAGVAIAEAARAWSAERAAAGGAPVSVGVGLHVGRVVVGSVGDARCLELAVLGDAVNVASRLEALTRQTGADVIASREVLDRAAAAGAGALVARFAASAPADIRGRAAAVEAAGLYLSPPPAARPPPP
ncbi:MAG: adenylate/guanylate cyclase domain-containing protein [Pseudomonadota bacterium]